MKKRLTLNLMLCMILCLCLGCSNRKILESEQQASTKETTQETVVNTEAAADMETSAKAMPETETTAESNNAEGYEEVILDDAELLED